MKKTTLFLFMLISGCAMAQTDSLYEKLTNQHFNKKRTAKIAALNIGIYGGSMTALYAAWYKKYPQSTFHTFNDAPEWMQMDKIGHTYSAYTMALYNYELWKTTGLSHKKRVWIAGLTGFTYQTVIEILDGFSADWGWSWSDVAANTTGSGLFIAQEFLWNDQRIKLKTSFHDKHYGDVELENRSNNLFGKTTAEKSLKDYNGQTYWATVNLKAFFPKSNLPKWLNIAVGTGAEGLFGARSNFSQNDNAQILFNRPDVKRTRQWYLAPDIDLSKIKTKSKFIKTGLLVLNSLKFPAPTIEIHNNKLIWHWIYF
jgi:hypothetical protein